MAKRTAVVQAEHRRCSSLSRNLGVAGQQVAAPAGAKAATTITDRGGRLRTSDIAKSECGALSGPLYPNFNSSAACPDAMFDTLLRLPAVQARTGLCRTAIYEGMNNGTFPRQRKLSTRAVAWSAAAIQHWINTRPYAKA